MPDHEVSAEDLIEKANEPSFVGVDGSQVTQRSAEDIIALDRYAASKQVAEQAANAGTGSLFGMRVRALKPGGCG